MEADELVVGKQYKAEAGTRGYQNGTEKTPIILEEEATLKFQRHETFGETNTPFIVFEILDGFHTGRIIDLRPAYSGDLKEIA